MREARDTNYEIRFTFHERRFTRHGKEIFNGKKTPSAMGNQKSRISNPQSLRVLMVEDSEDDTLFTTDMAMLHMMGIDLARELTQIRPDLPIILFAGAVDELDRGLLRTLGVRRLI